MTPGDDKVQTQVNSDDPAVVARVEQLLCFYVSGLSDAAEAVAVDVTHHRDPLGGAVYGCRVAVRRGTGQLLEVEEHQGDLVIGITRALDRCVRTLRRQQHSQRLSRPG